MEETNKHNEPLVSVVIPAFQAENTIAKCLNSVLNQTYKKLEIIVINDGSTDNTHNIVEQISVSDNRVSIIDKINEGVGSARNLGVSTASGDWLMFVDSDDQLQSDSIESLLVMSAADIVVSRISSSGYIRMLESLQTNVVLPTSVLSNLFDTLYYNRFFNSSCGKLYKRDLIKNIFFPTSIRVGEDLLFNLEAFFQASSFAAIDKIGYKYIPNVFSATHRYNSIDFDQQKQIRSIAHHIAESFSSNQKCFKAIDIVFVVNTIDIVVNLVSFQKCSYIIKELKRLYIDETFSKLVLKYKRNDLGIDYKRALTYQMIRNKSIVSLLVLGRLNRIRAMIKKHLQF